MESPAQYRSSNQTICPGFGIPLHSESFLWSSQQWSMVEADLHEVFPSTTANDSATSSVNFIVE
ncbi:hypothetical protein PR003_g12580 [Phytophthora rubi]|uniref:Uncharacterized protein n=1 Tax=Phytophthora rubi TaxID=129364 RepID=A0A6A4F7S0_9STRA|nr:hypothetical protein PR003_g12580 [Phytophthora rubi]